MDKKVNVFAGTKKRKKSGPLPRPRVAKRARKPGRFAVPVPMLERVPSPLRPNTEADLLRYVSTAPDETPTIEGVVLAFRIADLARMRAELMMATFQRVSRQRRRLSRRNSRNGRSPA